MLDGTMMRPLCVDVRHVYLRRCRPASVFLFEYVSDMETCDFILHGTANKFNAGLYVLVTS